MERPDKKNVLTLVFVYSGEFAERVIRNLINDPSYCKPCGLYCDSCKYGAYTHVRNIKAAIELASPSKLPDFIDNPDEHMPKKIPKADLCIASGLHKDLLLELPNRLRAAEVKGLITPIEDSAEVPAGLEKQLQEKCREAGVESAFPKPFCSLEPSDDKPTISRCVTELGIGKPLLEISVAERGRCRVIEAAIARCSAPCGSTWYVARKLTGVSTEQGVLYDVIAKAHHSYPCTAAMNVDPVTKEPILHLGGYLIREAVEKAVKQNRK